MSVWSYGLIIRNFMFNLNTCCGTDDGQRPPPAASAPWLTFVTLHQLRAESSSALNQQRGQPRPSQTLLSALRKAHSAGG